jgi:hypothetical protein
MAAKNDHPYHDKQQNAQRYARPQTDRGIHKASLVSVPTGSAQPDFI